MEDYASGEARLVLCAGIKTRQQIIELNRPDRHARQNLYVYPHTQTSSKRGLRAAYDLKRRRIANRLVRTAKERMRKGRNSARKRNLRPEEVCMNMDSIAKECRTVMTAEIRCKPQPPIYLV